MTEVELQEVVETQENQETDKKDAVISLVENPEDDDPENPRPKRIDFPLIPCGVVTLVLFVVFVILYILLLLPIIGIQDESDPYFQVVVSPFSNDYSNYLIVAPCYYPIFKNMNETDVVACEIAALPPDTYFCPIGYVCLTDSDLVDEPHVGCWSLEFSCEDDAKCISEIDDLSFINKSHREKELSLEYSKWHYYLMLLDSVVGFISFIVLVAAIVLYLKKSKRIYSIILVIASNFILVAAYVGMIAASEGFFHYTRMDSGTCYNDPALNDALYAIQLWTILFLGAFISAAISTVFMMFQALLMFGVIHVSFWKHIDE